MSCPVCAIDLAPGSETCQNGCISTPTDYWDILDSSEASGRCDVERAAGGGHDRYVRKVKQASRKFVEEFCELLRPRPNPAKVTDLLHRIFQKSQYTAHKRKLRILASVCAYLVLIEEGNAPRIQIFVKLAAQSLRVFKTWLARVLKVLGQPSVYPCLTTLIKDAVREFLWWLASRSQAVTKMASTPLPGPEAKANETNVITMDVDDPQQYDDVLALLCKSEPGTEASDGLISEQPPSATPSPPILVADDAFADLFFEDSEPTQIIEPVTAMGSLEELAPTNDPLGLEARRILRSHTADEWAEKAAQIAGLMDPTWVDQSYGKTKKLQPHRNGALVVGAILFLSAQIVSCKVTVTLTAQFLGLMRTDVAHRLQNVRGVLLEQATFLGIPYKKGKATELQAIRKVLQRLPPAKMRPLRSKVDATNLRLEELDWPSAVPTGDRNL